MDEQVTFSESSQRRIVTCITSRVRPFYMSEELSFARKRQRCKDRIIDGFLDNFSKNHIYFRFLTLTLASDYNRVLRQDWETLKKRIKRKQEGIFEYLRVRVQETGKNLHIHCIFVGDYIPKEWLSRQWEDITQGSFIVDIKLIRFWKNRGVTRIMRYFARNAVGEYFLENIEKNGSSRMSTSRGWIRKETKAVKKELKLNFTNKWVKPGVMLKVSDLTIISRLFNLRWQNHFNRLISEKYPWLYWRNAIDYHTKPSEVIKGNPDTRTS